MDGGRKGREEGLWLSGGWSGIKDMNNTQEIKGQDARNIRVLIVPKGVHYKSSHG